MRKEIILVTGANGEIGHSLIKQLGGISQTGVVAIDLKPLDECLTQFCDRFILGDILDKSLLGRLSAEYDIKTIFHLASILSTKAEYNPETAHQINVEGTINLLRLGMELSQWQGKSVKFIYPSSIAAYGLPDINIKMNSNKIKEVEFADPITMYGINKLYCEHLGSYYARHYRQLAKDRPKNSIDFRCIRFPGLISAETVPTGGTSDYGAEMFHNAAQGQPYSCFVRPDTTLPFMVMPDAVKSLMELERVSRDSLTQLVYNVTSFSISAQKLSEIVRMAFPRATITFEINQSRQTIVDSWPADVDDNPARKDWGWSPDFDIQQSFMNYLIPAIKERYCVKNVD